MKLTGIIKRVTYQSDETGYAVIKLENGSAAVGVLTDASAGERYEFTGEWVTHPQYGKQFKFENARQLYPVTTEGIKKYLGSGLIKGIGPVTADRIVNVFGEKTLDVINTDIVKLKEVPGIGTHKFNLIKEGWNEQRAVRDIMLFLQSHNISPAFAVKIYKRYGEEAARIVRENPYRLSFEIHGIGFKTADLIGRSLGFDTENLFRIKAGLYYILHTAGSEGHVYLPFSVLKEKCREHLGVELSIDGIVIKEMLRDEQLVIKEENIYLPSFYKAERDVEKYFRSMIVKSDLVRDPAVKKLRLDTDFYSDEQLEAMRNSLRYKMLIITGGPGTGKTTVQRGIIDIYKKLKKKIALAAPTGRAAKRMTEVIGMRAKTIHRLLEYNPASSEFNRNSSNPIDADMLIIDEVSMIDTILMADLTAALDKKTTIILVGDPDQLPSIGPGNVLRDLINSGEVPKSHLSKIFRQAARSDIVVNAHKINRSETPDLTVKKDSDFFFIEETEYENIPGLIAELASGRLPRAFGFDPMKDIQVITPMYKGPAGADNLNLLLQDTLNPTEVIFTKGTRRFKRSDKVMQLKNNYDLDVYNGDIGSILDIDIEKQIFYIDFNGRQIKYDLSLLDELTLAYAITVHKSQGSEFDCVIFPLTTAHYIMLGKNLLYTGITRAGRLLVLTGSKKALSIAMNNKTTERYSSLLK